MPSTPSGDPKIRIIIPVHRDRETLARLLPDLLQHWEPHELQVAGTDADDCAAVARQYGVPSLIVEEKNRGRARQMNAAARLHPEAERLLFLHADTRLPAEARDSLARAWRAGAPGGAFSRRYQSPSRFLRFSCVLADWRVKTVGLAFGDQAIFVRRDLFDTLGGFPDQPLFEDWDFSRALRKHGRLQLLKPGILTSARRFEKDGPLLRTLKDLGLTLKYQISGFK